MAALGAALAITACGGSGSNGIASKSPDQILNAASNALTAAKSVRAELTGKTDGVSFQGDFEFVASKGTSGTLTSGHGVMNLIVSDGTVYLKGNGAVWNLLTHNTAAGQLLGGKWVKASTSDTSVSGIGDLSQLTFTGLIGAFRQNHGTLTKGSSSTLNGQKVIALRSSKGGTLYVATTGKPYVVRTVGGTVGTGTLSDYGHSFSITPPSSAINLASLEQSGG